VRIRKPKSKPAAAKPGNGDATAWANFVATLTPAQRKEAAEALEGQTPRGWMTLHKTTVDMLIKHVQDKLGIVELEPELDDLAEL